MGTGSRDKSSLDLVDCFTRSISGARPGLDLDNGCVDSVSLPIYGDCKQVSPFAAVEPALLLVEAD